MEPLVQYDPLTKYNIKDKLYSVLYGPVDNVFRKRIEGLIIQNCSLINNPHKHFVYKGELYNIDQTKLPLKQNRLAQQLRPIMDDYLQDLNQLNDKEMPYVMNLINKILNSSNSLSDYKELLPESIKPYLEEFEAACPCRQKHLTKDDVLHFQQANADQLALMRERMMQNLLL